MRNASVAPIGNPGLRSQYYWVVTNGLFGQGPLAGPFVLSRAGDTFGASYALASGTYTSGITATGTVGQTCSLTAFNHGSSARATVALTGLNTIAGGTSLVFANLGSGATAAPDSATAGNGSATCSGTATIATVLGSDYSAGAQLQWSAVPGATGYATSYDCLRTATAAPPSGTGNYAVATGLTSPGCTDLSESLSSYTVNPSDPAEVAKRMQNQATGVDTSCVAIDGVCIATGSGAAFYQTDQQAGAAKPQELVNNFLSGFTLTDDPGNQSTDIKLTAFGNTCPEGEVQNGFNSDGSISCVAGGGGGSGNVYAPQKVELSSPVTLDTTQTIILTESVTFPSTAGVYRADVRYGVWLNSDGSRFCAIEAVDTTNGIAFAMGGAGTQGTSVYYSPTASEISTATYAAGSTATFTLQSVCNATGISAVPSNLASSVLPPEPSYLSVTPIGPPTGGGGAPSEPLYSVQTNYPDGSFGNGLGDFLDYAPIFGPLTFTGDGIDAEIADHGSSTMPEFFFAVNEFDTSNDPCPACFLVNARDTIQDGGNIGLSAYGETGGVVAIMGASSAQGPLSGPYGNPGSVLIVSESDVTGSLTNGAVTINAQPYDDLAGDLADVGNVAVNACGTSEDGIPAGGESCNVTLTANGLQQSYGYGGNVNLDAFGPTLAADTPGADSGNVNLSAYSAGVASENGSINLITFNSGSGPFDDTENDITLFALNHIYLQSADLVTGTAPICPNGPDGALVNDGTCVGGGGGSGTVGAGTNGQFGYYSAAGTVIGGRTLIAGDIPTLNYQAPLGLLEGTYVDGDLCTYASSGTLLNCNTAPGGTGTVTDGSGSTTTPEFAESTSTAHQIQYRTPAQALSDIGAAAAPGQPGTPTSSFTVQAAVPDYWPTCTSNCTATLPASITAGTYPGWAIINNSPTYTVTVSPNGFTMYQPGDATAVASAIIQPCQSLFIGYDGTNYRTSAVQGTPSGISYPCTSGGLNPTIGTLNQNTTGTAANLSGTPALPNGTTAVTQSALDDSTKLSTTAYTDAAVGVETAARVAAIPANITTQGNTFNGNTQLVQTTSAGKLPAIDGSLLTNLPGGTVTRSPNITLSAPVTSTTMMLVYPVSSGTVTVPSNCSTWLWSSTATATASTTWVVAKNGSAICTGTILASGSTITWTGTGSATTLASGTDVLTVNYSGDATNLGGLTAAWTN